MAGTIRTYQKCPKCGASFPSSKGDFPIICKNGCQTQPTKYYINIFWNGKASDLHRDKSGQHIRSWQQAVVVLGGIRDRMASHKTGKGFFNPEAYKKQSSTSFISFWDRFKKKHGVWDEAKNKQTGSTYEKIDVIGRLHLTYFHDMQMRDITAWQVSEWWQELIDKGVSQRYMNDILNWVKSFFNNALELEVIEKKPVFPKPFSLPAPEVGEWLTEDQQLSIMAHIPEHDRRIFDFLFLTGCRVNEACALKRTDIHPKQGVVYIQNTIKRDGSIGQVKNKKIRPIPYNAVKVCFDNEVISLTGFVFINKWGRRYSDDYLRDTFNRACDAAKIKRIKLKNATRHSFGMYLVKKGYDAWQISKAMNHSDVKVTEHYIKMLDKEISGMYDRCETVVKEKNNDISN